MRMITLGFLRGFKTHTIWAVVIWGIIISLLSSLPYIWGFLKSDDNFVYLGRSIVNSADTYIFLSHIESVKQGYILLPNLYTSDLRDTYFIKPLYIFLGLVAKTFSVDSLAIYHASRLFLILTFVYILWFFLAFFIKDFRKRFLSLVVVTTSSGVGYFLKESLASSIDLWVPEAITFFSFMEAPHFIWSQICVLVAMIGLLKFQFTRKYFHLFYASIFTALVILEHPYLIPFLLLFLPIFLLFGTKTFAAYLKSFAWLLGLPILTTLLLFLYTRSSEGFALYSKQVILSTPPLVSVLSGFGLLLPLAIYGLFKSRIREIAMYLLILWAVLLLILIYMPISFQRRLLETLHIPIALFASLAILQILAAKRVLTKLLVALLVLVLASTNVFLIYNAFKVIGADSKFSYSHHIYEEDLEGLIWLKNNSERDDIILASFYYSNIIPGITGRYVYSGHLFNTVNARAKLRELNKFMEGSSDQREAFLKKVKPRFIFFGKVDPYNVYRESLIDDGLIPIWSENGVLILEVEIT